MTLRKRGEEWLRRSRAAGKGDFGRKKRGKRA